MHPEPGSLDISVCKITQTELSMPAGEFRTSQPETSILENYPGAKANSGIAQFLINHIPYHRRYHEVCAGSAQLYLAKAPAEENYLVDIDPAICAALRSTTDATVYNQSVVDYLYSLLSVLGPSDFIYLDPPYNEDARRGNRRLYRFEMLKDSEHMPMLNAIRSCAAMVMISTRQNELYSTVLADWRMAAFDTVDRAGPEQELIYMNYPVPKYLHQYDMLGTHYIDRQRIKRKAKERFYKKIAKLPAFEKHLFIQELIKNDAAAVQHFLTVNNQR